MGINQIHQTEESDEYRTEPFDARKNENWVVMCNALVTHILKV